MCFMWNSRSVSFRDWEEEQANPSWIIFLYFCFTPHPKISRLGSICFLLLRERQVDSGDGSCGHLCYLPPPSSADSTFAKTGSPHLTLLLLLLLLDQVLLLQDFNFWLDPAVLSEPVSTWRLEGSWQIGPWAQGPIVHISWADNWAWIYFAFLAVTFETSDQRHISQSGQRPLTDWLPHWLPSLLKHPVTINAWRSF